MKWRVGEEQLRIIQREMIVTFLDRVDFGEGAK